MKNKGGFTLVEVLIATLVLLLIVGAFFSTLMQSSYLINGRTTEDIVLGELQRQMERVTYYLVSSKSTDPEPNPTYTLSTEFLTGVRNYGSTPIIQVTVTRTSLSSLIRADAVVNWVQPDGRRVTRNFTFYLVRKS